MRFTAVYQEVPEGGYVAWVEELPGAHTQAETLEEARKSLAEVVKLVLEGNRQLATEYANEERIIREPLDISA